MPKVSVIIPTYNREDFIEETIQSVLDQTYKDFEIIVVDDGSTDNTKKKLEKFNSKIKLIEQKNSERAVSRNNGIKNAQGEYIAFLDSDDLWFKNKLEKQVEVLDKNKDYVLTYCQCLRINENGLNIKIAERQLKGYSGYVYEKLLMRNFITSPTPLVKRECIEKIKGFETKYIPYEDWEFWVRLSLLGKFYFIKEPLAHYRIHETQSVKLAKAEKIEEVTTSLLENSFTHKEIPTELKNKSLGLANLRFTYWYLIANDTSKAKEKLRKCLSLYPNFLIDPRWLGLNLVCNFPKLKGKWLFELEQYH